MVWNCVSCFGESHRVSLLFFLPSPLTYVAIFPFLFLLSAEYAKHSQVQPFSVPNTLLKTPQRLPKPKRGFSCTIVTSKLNMLCSVRTIYTSTSRASFPSFCFQGTTLCNYRVYIRFVRKCLCVFAGRVNGCCLAEVVWFSRWHKGTPLAAAQQQLPQDSYNCEIY